MEKLTQKTYVITTILILTLSLILVTLPAVSAQDTYREKTTHAYIGATPNPVGVGQQVLLHVGITDYLVTVSDGWEGLTVTVKDPAGNEQTLGPYRSDATGGTGAVFVPDMVGTYTFQTHFPAQWYNWTRAPLFDPDVYGNIWYKSSDSDPMELVVTQEGRAYYPDQSLPTEYWSRPIDAQLREWNTISANWIGRPTNLYAPYNDDAPETGHILWAKPLTYGGLAGGEMGSHAFDCGDAYEGKFASPVILDGILFYNRFQDRMPQDGVVAVDLHTGEELWSRNNTIVSRGQVFYWDSYNMHSVFAYVWETRGSTWNAYNPYTGDWVYTMENVPSGSVRFGASYTVIGPKGEILIYETDIENGWMALWNSSRVVSNAGSWRPQGRVYDDAGERGQEWNITIPSDLPGGIRATLEDRMIGNTATGWTGMGDEPIESWCISLEPGHEGELMWENSYTPPPGELSIGFGGASLEDGVFVYEIKERVQYVGFDLDTGDKIWGPTESGAYLGIYGMDTYIADGKLFSSGYHGYLYCYDITTGLLDWTYTAVDEFTEILWSDNWPVFPMFITDGKIYLQHHEHSPIDPKPRGAPLLCIDIESGDKVWSLPIRGTSWGGDPAIGDSIIAMYNTYDQQIYAIGKGPSKTTVTTPGVGIPLGSSVMISGMVTDISPGTTDYRVAARFPNGVSAVSDASITEWMKYVYMQFERPSDISGVPVTLDAVDSNGNFISIGTVMTDSSGFYSHQFTPEIEGKYTIIATFAGSNAYYASYSEAAVGVDAATPSTPIEPEQPEQPSTETPLITTEVAIIAAIAVASIIGVAAFWALRKRK